MEFAPTVLAFFLLIGYSVSKECKNRLSAYKCHLIARHGLCTTKKDITRFYCERDCGFCGERCHATKYGCCSDAKTPALGPNHYGCKESCRDTAAPYFCQSIVRVGFCNKKGFSALGRNCLQSCKICRTCKDQDPRGCKMFALGGQCEKDKVTTFNKCRKSCQVCGPKDPCSGFHCRGKNSKCRVDHEGKPFCACRTHCKLYEYFTGQVCGRDGKQYKNLCHLRHSNCELPYPVSIKKYGRCNPRYLSAGAHAAAVADTIKSNKVSKTILAVGDCTDSKFGCCPDGHSFVKGKNAKGCLVKACKDKSKAFCSRFAPECSSSNTWSRTVMRLRCPKTCFYCGRHH